MSDVPAIGMGRVLAQDTATVWIEHSRAYRDDEDEPVIPGLFDVYSDTTYQLARRVTLEEAIAVLAGMGAPIVLKLNAYDTIEQRELLDG